MEVAIFKDSATASRAAAQLIARVIRKQSGAHALGFATGGTPQATYAELVRLHRERLISFKNTTAFNLDEYVGLAKDSPQSYAAYMREHLFNHVDINASRCHIPDGKATDLESECAAYEAKILAAGGIELQLLGLGHDGHIGFNEPSSSLSSRTRLKTLSALTRTANAPHFGGASNQVPAHVLTMGLGTIMEARQCVLLAFGAAKAEAVLQMVEGPLSASVPASILQMHTRCTVIVDEAAAKALTRSAYYREVFAQKPDWQRWDLSLI